MSGSSYNYAFRHVEDVAEQIERQERRIDVTPNLLRLRFATHLRAVAKAMHDIELVDSKDYARGDEDRAIRECLPEVPA